MGEHITYEQLIWIQHCSNLCGTACEFCCVKWRDPKGALSV